MTAFTPAGGAGSEYIKLRACKMIGRRKARVFPLPVGPVTNTIPCGEVTDFINLLKSFSSNPRSDNLKLINYETKLLFKE